MKASLAVARLTSMAPYSQSRAHEAPKLSGESPADYDLRTWREHMHVKKIPANKEKNIAGGEYVSIPEDGLMQSLVSGAAYCKKKIIGKGNSTWTTKFRCGVAIRDDIITNVLADSVGYLRIYANADGVRGSGKRVFRHFPNIIEWSAEVRFMILDPIITADVFAEMLIATGHFVGIGRFRPEKGGTNGRFNVAKLDWQDNREFK